MLGKIVMMYANLRCTLDCSNYGAVVVLTAETQEIEPIPSGQDSAVSRVNANLRPDQAGSAATVLMRSRSNSWIGAVTPSR